MRPRAAAVGTAAAAAVVLALLPFTLSGYHQALAAQVAVFFVAILGLNVLTGYTGQISIGHGAFMAIGGYTTAVLSRDHHMSLVLTMVIAFAVCFLCGLLVGLPALRLSGVYLALATFALAVSVPQIPLKFSTYLGGSGGVQSAKTVGHLWLYGTSWTVAAILFVLASLILRGRTGRAFRAIRDSEVAATSSGVELPVYKTLAFGVSAAFAGVAGSLFVMGTNGFAQPSEFGILLSLQILVGAAVAGLGSLSGVLAGAAFVGLLPTISSDVPVIGSTHGQDVVFGALVIAVMLLLPTGVAGLVPRLRRLRTRA
jgi:branched-chain amino acid transport system permease protein